LLIFSIFGVVSAIVISTVANTTFNDDSSTAPSISMMGCENHASYRCIASDVVIRTLEFVFGFVVDEGCIAAISNHYSCVLIHENHFESCLVLTDFGICHYKCLLASGLCFRMDFSFLHYLYSIYLNKLPTENYFYLRYDEHLFCPLCSGSEC